MCMKKTLTGKLTIIIVVCLINFISENIATEHQKVASDQTHSRNITFAALPDSWRNVCDINIVSLRKPGIQELSLSCTITRGGMLSLPQLRPYTAALTRSIVHVIIRCDNDGKLIFPWPGKVKNVQNLTIEGCLLAEYNSEYFDIRTDKMKNNLRCLKLKDCLILVDNMYVPNQVRASLEPVTKSADCLPLQAEEIIRNNVSFLYNFSTDEHQIFIKTIQKANKQSWQRKTQCIYKNLRIFDNSHTQSLGVNPSENVLRNAVFPALQIFNLSGNGLREIPPRLKEWKLYYGELRTLDLSFNNIAEVSGITDHSDGTQIMKDFDTINLQYNSIATITKRAMLFFVQHRHLRVDLRNNPFVCNCDMKYFLTFFNSQNNLSSDLPYSYFRKLVCSEPENLKGRKILSLTLEDIGCITSSINPDFVPIITLSVLLSFIVGVFVTLFMFRKEITIICFTQLHVYLPCQTNYVDHDKTFDAFVAYSERDAVWVLHTLLPRLEHVRAEKTFNLCLHHRDFRLGAAIADNIVSSVEDSRHTLLVVSNDFLKSEWCHFEFRTALEQSLLEKKKHLIIILLENVQKKDIVGDLKRCLKTMTCIKVNDRWFWDKLVHALSDNQKKKNVFV